MNKFRRMGLIDYNGTLTVGQKFDRGSAVVTSSDSAPVEIRTHATGSSY